MLFSSMMFLWFFLPIVFCLYYLAKEKYRNGILLISSLIFYFWGEPILILVMLSSAIGNFGLGILMDKRSNRKFVLVLGIIFNILLLGYFKYFSSILSGIERITHMGIIDIKSIVLPLGISFYTFQSMSYIIDLYRGDISCQKNIINFILYVSFFPQLIAGPIVKYKDVEAQIAYRVSSKDGIASGISRFVYGLGKKVIVSNTLASSVDKIFGVPINEIDFLWAWGGVILYTLQIYYDFSGYSDMAIGLGRMFGFEFQENFNYPYISSSIKEFWRKWHISLSTWFREYVYIPLGGNRKGKIRTYINLWLVFIVTGIWHGASLNFLLWGIWHGFFIFIERLGFGKILDKNKIKIINHIYALFIISVGWAIFRCNSLEEAISILIVILGFDKGNRVISWYEVLSVRVIIIAVFAVLASGPIQSAFHNTYFKRLSEKWRSGIELGLQVIIMGIVFIMLISGQYNPFIYFKF